MKKKISALIICLLLISICMPLCANAFSTTRSSNSIPAFDPIEQFESIEKTADGIKNYRNKNNVIVDEIEKTKLQDVFCTITFKKGITLEVLRELAIKYDMNIDVVELRHYLGEKRLTSAIIFEKNWDNMIANIDEINRNLQEAKYVGIIDVYARIDAVQLKNLKREALIYLIDVSGDAASLGSEIMDGEKRNEYRFDDGIDDYPKSLAWELEDMENGTL